MSNRLDESNEEERQKKAKIGYQTAIELVGLTSHEIYSRFNAMLTANSIILAVIGWAITSRGFPTLLTMSLPVAGMFLCGTWFLFVHHGVYWQDKFREEAQRLERQYYVDTFKLISTIEMESPKSSKTKSQSPTLIRWFKFYNTSRIVIAIFVIIYIVMLFQILWVPPGVADP